MRSVIKLICDGNCSRRGRRAVLQHESLNESRLSFSTPSRRRLLPTTICGLRRESPYAATATLLVATGTLSVATVPLGDGLLTHTREHVIREREEKIREAETCGGMKYWLSCYVCTRDNNGEEFNLHESYVEEVYRLCERYTHIPPPRASSFLRFCLNGTIYLFRVSFQFFSWCVYISYIYALSERFYSPPPSRSVSVIVLLFPVSMCTNK